MGMQKWDALVPLVVVLYVFACPFTKVEESFNVQALHDILFHRADFRKYDHLEFPGVVPRTFLGAVTVSLLSAPFVFISQLIGLPKFAALYIARVVLGLLVTWSLLKFRSAAERHFGLRLSSYFALVSISQFHFLFYASRPLPNTFALIIVLHCFSSWLNGSARSLIFSCALAGLVFRGELILLLGPIVLMHLSPQTRGARTRFWACVRYSLQAVPLWLGLSVAVDSLFWQRWLWPEGEVLWYNTILNKSSNWGTMPFLWYFYSALPRSLLLAIPLAVVGTVASGRRVIRLIAPALVFIFLYSFLPHKELRFVVYTIPLFNVAAAIGLKQLWEVQSHRLLSRLACVVCVAVGVLASSGFLYISHHNYPGGVALQQLHRTPAMMQGGYVSMHICNAAAQTGVTRFGQENDGTWRYSKKENLQAGDALLPYSHILVEAKDVPVYSRTHRLLFTVQGLSGIEWRKAPRGIKLQDKLALLERNTPILDKRKVQK